MATAKIYTAAGDAKGDTSLPAALFDAPVHTHAMWEAVKCYNANQRQGTASTKTRATMTGGGRKTHGCTTHDQPGSIGASAYPSRVIKGKRLPGHMGNVTRTAKNVTVVDVNEEQHLLLVHGSVPGARNSFLLIHEAPEPKPRVRRVGETA